VRLLEI
jgi:hypothetical protein